MECATAGTPTVSVAAFHSCWCLQGFDYACIGGSGGHARVIMSTRSTVSHHLSKAICCRGRAMGHCLSAHGKLLPEASCRECRGRFCGMHNWGDLCLPLPSHQQEG